jgi:hypothetical protein
MSLEHYTDHLERMLARRTHQFSDATNFEKLLNVFGPELQEIEDVFYELSYKLSIEFGEGTQLDKMGNIVDQGRLGFSDAIYQVLLWAAIGRNTSSGQPPKIIDVYRLITQSTIVYYEEQYPGDHALMGDGEILDALVNFIYDSMERTILNGTRLVSIGTFSKDRVFAFEGSPLNSPGFSDVNDLSAGGLLATVVPHKRMFRFEGPGATWKNGFSDASDPAAGGRLQTAA